MGDPIIWKVIGFVSATSGLVIFALSSTYKLTFCKLGIGGLLIYALVSTFMFYLILPNEGIVVPKKYQGVAISLMVDAICLISVLHDKFLNGKSDALSIISYGLFALMSLSVSGNFELGFETGVSSFFLQLFFSEPFKIKAILLPIAVVLCPVIIILRHYPESQSSQDTQGMGKVSGLSSLLYRNNEKNNQEESSQASPSNGKVAEESRLGSHNIKINEQERKIVRLSQLRIIPQGLHNFQREMFRLCQLNHRTKIMFHLETTTSRSKRAGCRVLYQPHHRNSQGRGPSQFQFQHACRIGALEINARMVSTLNHECKYV